MRKVAPSMVMRKPKEFLIAVPPKMRLLALDYGDRRIGVAVSDRQWSLASPLTVIRRTSIEQDIAQIAKLMQEYRSHALVIGWPRNMDGSEGPRCDKTHSFIDLMLKSDHIPANTELLLWDERLTSHAAEREMIEIGNLSRKKRKGKIDMMAAQLILEDALAGLQRLKQAEEGGIHDSN